MFCKIKDGRLRESLQKQRSEKVRQKHSVDVSYAPLLMTEGCVSTFPRDEVRTEHNCFSLSDYFQHVIRAQRGVDLINPVANDRINLDWIDRRVYRIACRELI